MSGWTLWCVRSSSICGGARAIHRRMLSSIEFKPRLLPKLSKENGFATSMQTCNSIAFPCGLILTANLGPCWSLDCELCAYSSSKPTTYQSTVTFQFNMTTPHVKTHSFTTANQTKTNCPSVTWATQTHMLLKILGWHWDLSLDKRKTMPWKSERPFKSSAPFHPRACNHGHIADAIWGHRTFLEKT